MGQSEPELLILLVPVIVLAAMISVILQALTSINRSRLKLLVDESSRQGQILEKLLQSPLDIITILGIWHHILILVIGILAGIWTIRNLLPHPVYFAFAIILLVLLVTVFEIFSWKIISSVAETLVLKTTGFLNIIMKISSPIIYVLAFVISPVTRLTGKANETKSLVTEDEIRMMVEEASAQGVFEEEEKEMIHSVIELGDTIAKEIMVPRLDIVGVELLTPLPKVLDTAMIHGLSRLPVYEDSIDRIVGLVHSKDLLALLNQKKMDTPLKEIIRPAYFIPGSKKIDEMLREMQKEKVAMAIVVDEYGGTDGLVTIEDIIEEIVGEITDEYDKDISPIQPLEDGTYLVDGKTIIEDVNQQLHLDLPAEEFETIGGYVYGLTGHIPKAGEMVRTDNITITVEKVNRQRITQVRIEKHEKESLAVTKS